MSDAAMPVDGPFRIYVEAIPAGAVLDVEAFVEHVVHDVVELLLGDTYGERFDALIDAQPVDRYIVQRPGDLPFESLVAGLTAAVDTKMPVYGAQVKRLGDRLRAIAAPKAVPAQRTEGGAAA